MAFQPTALRSIPLFAHIPDEQRALGSFSRVVEIDPENRFALEKLLALHEEAGDWETALALLARLVQLEPDAGRRVPLLHHTARVQIDRFRDKRGALDTLRRALAIDPLRVETIAEITRFYENQGEFPSARVLLDTSIQQLRQAAAQKPLDPAAYHALFECFRLRRSNDQALVTADLRLPVRR